MTDEEMIRELAETTARSKSNTKRIDRLEQIQSELKVISTTLVKVGDKVEYLGNSVNSLTRKVEAIEENPKKTLGTIKSAIITSIISGLIAIAISVIFAVTK